MMMHLIQLLRKRMRGNLLLLSELILSFLVVFGVGITLFNFWDNYTQPMGYNYENISSIHYAQSWDKSYGPKIKRAMEALRALPEVEHVEIAQHPGYTNNTWGSGGIRTEDREDAKRHWSRFNEASDNYHKLAGIKVIHGRWFGPEDDGITDVEPVVLNAMMARTLFGREDVAGKMLYQEDVKRQVVGVIEDYRQFGPARAPMDYLFRRYSNKDLEEGRYYRTVVYRVKEGTPADFEAKALEVFHQAVPELSFSIIKWADSREHIIKESMVGMWALILITGFLLLMVVLGMLGVLWQSITSRTRELGLRRALGSPSKGIMWQIIIELVLLALLGIAIGSFLAVQLPLTGWFAQLEWGLVLRGMIGSGLIILTLSIVCAWYPGYMAMRVTPADALRYE